MAPEEGSVTPVQLQMALAATTAASGMILSLALEPVPYQLVQRIHTRQFVEMRDLLSNNIALHHVPSLPGGSVCCVLGLLLPDICLSANGG